MSNAAHRPLVPLADRVYPSPMGEEDSQRQTIWRNPTNLTVKLEIQIETPKPGRPPRTYDERRGTHTYYVKPGEEKALPSSYDRQIQTYQCHHIDCLHAPFDCKKMHDEGHEKTIVGGCAPQLENRGSQRAPIASGFVQLAPALDDVEARRKAAEAEEFAEWQRGRMAEQRNAAAAQARERAEKEIAEREERKVWEAEKERASKEAAASVERDAAAAIANKNKK